MLLPLTSRTTDWMPRARRGRGDRTRVGIDIASREPEGGITSRTRNCYNCATAGDAIGLADGVSRNYPTADPDVLKCARIARAKSHSSRSRARKARKRQRPTPMDREQPSNVHTVASGTQALRLKPACIVTNLRQRLGRIRSGL